jgi:hypothetical protein
MFMQRVVRSALDRGLCSIRGFLARKPDGTWPTRCGFLPEMAGGILDRGWIQHSTAGRAAAVAVAREPGGTWRIRCDYRGLAVISRGAVEPPPHCSVPPGLAVPPRCELGRRVWAILGFKTGWGGGRANGGGGVRPRHRGPLRACRPPSKGPGSLGSGPFSFPHTRHRGPLRQLKRQYRESGGAMTVTAATAEASSDGPSRPMSAGAGAAGGGRP